MLVSLLSHEQPDVQKAACGALRNLSCGRANDTNKVGELRTLEHITWSDTLSGIIVLGSFAFDC